MTFSTGPGRSAGLAGSLAADPGNGQPPLEIENSMPDLAVDMGARMGGMGDF
jgi:hypothetical protein